ncbi:class I SAM-dependent methyltransferase [Herbidospora mongoliensis]|uniref:class I SAM-dependent methyltransferase n=1 Tax=Herbidospora mongoliensis TaxID=688067 RepID=UPI00082FBA60|nr:methyltransferase domain-containing protein [Herbidospora mongoliensis]
MDTAKIEEFAMKIAMEGLGSSLTLQTHLGDRLGLFRAMAGAGPVTSHELADRTGLSERYVREWLQTQAIAEHIGYDPATRSFELPDEHALVLADDTTIAARASESQVQAASWKSADQLAEAFRSGDGVAWHRHDDNLFGGVSRFFGPLYRFSLVDHWLPALEGVTERLTAGARVLDVGCGLGTSTILMAEAFPASRFEGVDYHEASIEDARQAAKAAGVDARVHFHVSDSTEEQGGTWDLICFFDALHDMGDPLEAARRARESLADGGTVLLVEPIAADRLEDSIGSPIAAAYSAASVMLCLPHGLSEGARLGLGNQAGPARIEALLREAGFSRVRLALSTDYNLVFEARA